MRGSDSVELSPLWPRGSAQVLGCIDVEHEPERVGEVDEGNIEVISVGVLCRSKDMARDK